MLSEVINKTVKQYEEGNYSGAITTVLTSDFYGDDPLLDYYLGLCYIKSGDYRSGREYLEDFVLEDDNLLRIFQTKMLIGYASIELNDFKDSIKVLTELVDSGYESAKLYSLLGFSYYKKGILSKSIRCYRKAIAIESDNANALNALGYILSEFPEDLKEAETLCRRALSIDVDNPAYLDSIGWICLKNRNYRASESFFSRALALAPDCGEIQGHVKELNEVRRGV